ncbi:phosphoribosylformylglycinamidine synthase subunit PurQ [Aliibacillus thermotolerans]|uniref:Phosphoribosylformylglycinamidine synthase subunit PurQ n=1 Tax=Aliibacillus thermotolerans TaxID=1834418 RepID=A0ABW0U8L5_9BACI|nr:phosphoribosylformylglycinamidine synthase subunit PurQ [Aliibacillus thermotolerans]MDA3130405.1 phosphoribosylformylglycinamidine synthase subunit PurQ [Aliibacillus thermotolerans]
MKWAVIDFPGSSGTEDILHVLRSLLNEEAEGVWYKDTDLSAYDVIILPSGASFGDYLRSGAIASITPAIQALKEERKKGKLICGIGNGFQILLEAGFLPGAIRRNRLLKFICAKSKLIVKNNNTPFTNQYEQQQEVNIPVAHQYGNYVCDKEIRQQLEENNQIVFQYYDDLNGSMDHIAGIVSEDKRVLGLMPHPERASESIIGSTDGLALFQSIIHHWREEHDRTS